MRRKTTHFYLRLCFFSSKKLITLLIRNYFSAVILNVLSLVALALVVGFHLWRCTFNWKNLLFAFGHHLLCLLAMLLLGLVNAGFLIAVGGTKTWNAAPPLVLVFYILPMLILGLMVHSIFAYRQQKELERGNEEKYEVGLLGFSGIFYMKI